MSAAAAAPAHAAAAAADTTTATAQAQQDPPPPAAAAAAAPLYVVPLAACTKRIRGFAADGQEERADDNPWVHMQLSDPFAPAQATDNNAAGQQPTLPAGGAGADAASADAAAAADGAAADDKAAAAAAEAPPRPDEVIKAFTAAKGELEWLQAMLNTLLDGRYLTVGRSERSQGPQRLADLAIAANARFRRRAAAAASAAAALAEGAAALTALGEKEDAFYVQVARLQRYWKVRQEPASSPYAYSINLNLPQTSTQQQQAAASAAAAAASGGGGGDASAAANASAEASAALVGRGAVPVVYILKDPAGMLRVQVPPPKTPGPPTVMDKRVAAPPAVYTGPAAIHGLLLQQLRLNAWHMVLASLDAEIAHMLGLPARFRPLRAASAAAAAAEQQQQSQQQQRLPSDAAGLAADFARAPSAGMLGLSQPGQSQPLSQPPSQQQQQLPAFAAGGHLTFYATLSSLALQAVAGAAATAGEFAILQQQQQQQQHLQRRQRQRHTQQQQQQAADGQQHEGSTSAVEASSLSGGLLLGAGGDVGEPWTRAAAAAAAATATCKDEERAAASGSAVPGAAAAAASGGDLFGGSVCLDPQLLSLRPLALEHLLITQLGHLLSGHLGSFSDPAVLAAVTYAATARQLQERARQQSKLRQQQQQAQPAAGGGAAAAALGSRDDGGAAGGAGARGGGGNSSGVVLKPGSYLFGAAVSLMTTVSRWLGHSANRDVLRAKVDAVLQLRPGCIARSLHSSHACVSALQLAAAPPPWGAAVVRPLPPMPPLLLLLSDTALTVEGAALSGPSEGGDRQRGQHGGRAADPVLVGAGPAQAAALGVQLQALPPLLEQLLPAPPAAAGDA